MCKVCVKYQQTKTLISTHNTGWRDDLATKNIFCSAKDSGWVLSTHTWQLKTTYNSISRIQYSLLATAYTDHTQTHNIHTVNK